MGTRKINSVRKKLIPHTENARDDAMSVEVDSPIARYYFRYSLMVIGITLFVMLFFFVAAFLLTVRGAERTVVPQIVGLELIEALTMLQERELNPRLQAKYTGDPVDKGLIIDQKPQPGLYVKAGRRIALTVSKGAIIDNVEDYVGKTIEEIRGHLATVFSTYEPLLVIREPIIYVYDESPVGTILSQTPKPGTPLSGPRELILIVSRGASDKPVIVPDWMRWNTDDVLQALSKLPLTFQFIQDTQPAQGTAPQITAQEPQPYSPLPPGDMVTLLYRAPNQIQEGFQYGLLEHVFPDYPVPVFLEAIVRKPGDKEQVLFSIPYLGGPISFPYVLPNGSSITLMINEAEAYRQEILAKD